jgi:hypothetical protein
MSGASESDDQLGSLPSERGGEIIEAVARGAVSSIPFIGGAVAELLGLVIQPAVEHRREEWFQQLGRAFEELRRRLDGFDPAELAKNEVFVTAVITTSNAALRTHEAEKLEALRNAVVNSGLPMAPQEHVQLMFIRMVDELTAFHLRLLAYCRDPEAWLTTHGIAKPNIYMGPRMAVAIVAMPELEHDAPTYKQAVRDLVARGLLQDSLDGMVSQQALYDSLTTEFGNRFLSYISPPT